MRGSGGPYLIDVALNLTDCVFRGVDWKGRRVHEDNFTDVLRRAEQQNVQKMIITGTNIAQCVKAVRLCRQQPSKLRCTVGIHPAHCAELLWPLDWKNIEEMAANDVSIQMPKPVPPAKADVSNVWQHVEEHLKKLADLVEENRDFIVGIGEIGLDYAEVSWCPIEVQQECFLRQLRSLRMLHLPFLFHSRDCGIDFVRLLEKEREVWPSDVPFTGVVHSFNGILEEQRRLLAMDGIYFSINGSAFREKTLAHQICRIQLDRIMLETDAPWCDIRKQHYGAQFVRTHFEANRKGKPFVAAFCDERRNEPCHLRQVLEAYVGVLRCLGEETNNMSLQNITEEEVVQQVYTNCVNVFHI